MLPTTSQSEIFREYPIPKKGFCEKYFSCCMKKKHKRSPTAFEMDQEQERERQRVIDAFARETINPSNSQS